MILLYQIVDVLTDQLSSQPRGTELSLLMAPKPKSWLRYRTLQLAGLASQLVNAAFLAQAAPWAVLKLFSSSSLATLYRQVVFWQSQLTARLPVEYCFALSGGTVIDGRPPTHRRQISCKLLLSSFDFTRYWGS